MAVTPVGRSISRRVFFVGFLLIFACCAANASIPSPKKSDPIQGAADRALSEYIARVRQQSETEPHAMGSIWSEDGAFTRLTADVRAMHAHDLISIVVVEALSASTDGSVKNSRSSSASSQIAALFAKLSSSNSMQNLLSPNSASALFCAVVWPLLFNVCVPLVAAV